MHDICRSFGKITEIYTEDISLTEPFIHFAGRFSHIPGTVILMSGGDLDCARYHILGTKPWLTLSARHLDITLSDHQTSISLKEDPFTILREIIRAYDITHFPKPEGTRQSSEFPISSGLLGYLSYDLKDCIETLPRTSMDRLALPHMMLFVPSILVVHDKLTEKTRLFIPKREKDNKNTFNEDIRFFSNLKQGPRFNHKDQVIRVSGLRSNFTKKNYVTAIKTIKEYIASGHVYQVNMSQRFEADFSGDPYRLFKTYYDLNPAPFYAFINAGDHQVVSTSPERFILRSKDQIETRPIKGTRPRGNTPEADEQLRKELFESKKDDAELSMIVDLLRNDIGKVCKGGSVYVSEHKRVEAYQNVYHLVSVVKGTLDTSYDSVDLIRAAFPGGSITGCPKIRSMEIIDEMETDRRHIYTGSIGYISFHDTLDLSIAIRTATVCNGKIVFSVGGGIVFDSDPEDEFEETLHKGRTLMTVFDRENGFHEQNEHKQEEKIWFNGVIIPIHQAAIPISDLGFQYGYGFFETIRADKGKVNHLPMHIERFEKTWRHFFPDSPPDLSWEEIIHQVLVHNHLEETIAAVKLVATKGTQDVPPFDHTLAVTAKPYMHRLEGKKETGLNLVIYPHPRQLPLSDHKTINYLYYYLAGKWAAKEGGDEALILNPNGTVSETNTANLLLIKDKTVVRPSSPHVLPGTMEKAVCDLLSDWGYGMDRKEVFPDDLFLYDDIWMTNALIGAVPVLRINGKELDPPTNLWRSVNRKVL